VHTFLTSTLRSSRTRSVCNPADDITTGFREEKNGTQGLSALICTHTQTCAYAKAISQVNHLYCNLLGHL